MDKTAVYNVRLDIRALAILHRHYTSIGVVIPSISSLNRRAIEFLADQLVAQKGAQTFTGISDAIEYLESQGMMGPLRTRGQSAIIRGMQQESLSLDGLDPDYANPKQSFSNDQIEAARRAMKMNEPDDLPGTILGPKPNIIKEE